MSGPLSLVLLKPGQFNALRSRYLNPRIAPGAANLAVAVKDGAGRVLGVFAMAPSSFTPDEAYLLSDFAVAPTGYPRLSKLIVLAATSSEARLLCQRAFCRRRAVSTTAFSNNPVSMRYRGLLRLTKRAPRTRTAGRTSSNTRARWAVTASPRPCRRGRSGGAPGRRKRRQETDHG